MGPQLPLRWPLAGREPPAASEQAHRPGHPTGPHLTRLRGCHEWIRTRVRTYIRVYPTPTTPQVRRVRGVESPVCRPVGPAAPLRGPAHAAARPHTPAGSRAQRLGKAQAGINHSRSGGRGGGGMSHSPPFPSAENELARLRAPLAVPARHARLPRARSHGADGCSCPLGTAR